MNLHILVVDDEDLLRASLVEILEGWGYACTSVADANTAVEALRTLSFGAALVDVRMPGVGGIELLRNLRSLAPDIPVLMMTGHPSVDTAVMAMKYGAVDFYTKPLDLKRLKEDLDRFSVAWLAGLRVQTPVPFRRLDGDSLAIRELRASIERVAPTDAPVIVTGESGTGKELIVETLHSLSRRFRAPLLKQNCAAIPENLLESEIFGHERGAFTGADARKPGLIERAKGGTVFLDEIGDMDIKLQAKLLRVLQDGDYRRVGGTEPLKADVRVVAATNRDLAALIVSGAFREDLYYRLSVICLHAPALRERTEDIPLLARHFCADFSRHYGKKAPELDEALLPLLMNQPWPGNVRELKNCLERAIIFCDDATIGPEHLPRQYRAAIDGCAPSDAGEKSPAAQDGAALMGAHDALERNLLLDALKRAGGNRTKAAEILGIHRRTLYYKLERLGLDSDGVARAP